MKMVEILLDANADVAAQANNGMTALHEASRNGHVEVVKLLLEAKADVAAQSNDGWTALHFASWDGHVEMVKLLLDSKADVAAQSNDGWTALHFASWTSHVEVVKLLLDSKADVAAQTNNGWTALQHAAWIGHYETMCLFLRALSTPAPPSNVQNIPDQLETRSRKAIDVLESLIMSYPNDDKLQRSLGNEYVRQQKYAEASATFDMSMRIKMRNTKVTEIEDICSDLSCDDCQENIRGYHYKCIQCDWDHDLCQACFQKSKHPHPSKELIMIPSAEFSANEDHKYEIVR